MYNRSQILKDVWHVKKRHNYSFGKSLKISWKYHKEKIINDNLKILIKENYKTLNYYSNYIAFKSEIQKEEAYQILLIKMYNSLKYYKKEKSSLKTFLNKVLKNHTSTIIKQSYQKREIEIDTEIIPCKFDCYQEIENKHFVNQIALKLDAVSKNICQQIIIGKSNKEIAENLNYSPNNVSNIIRRKIRPQLIQEFC